MKTPAQKMHIKPEMTVQLVSDAEFDVSLVGELTLVEADADVVLLVAESKAELEKRLPSTLQQDTIVWVIYPKRPGADINRDVIWVVLEEHGWKAVANIAISEEWSSTRGRVQ